MYYILYEGLQIESNEPVYCTVYNVYCTLYSVQYICCGNTIMRVYYISCVLS